MTITTSPAPPRRILDGTCRPVESVRLDGRYLGTIERHADGSWLARLAGNLDAVPTTTGTRFRAIDELVRFAGLPSGYRHLDARHRVPKKLVIGRIAAETAEEIPR